MWTSKCAMHMRTVKAHVVRAYKLDDGPHSVGIHRLQGEGGKGVVPWHEPTSCMHACMHAYGGREGVVKLVAMAWHGKWTCVFDDVDDSSGLDQGTYDTSTTGGNAR